jgi:hypothetical protein
MELSELRSLVSKVAAPLSECGTGLRVRPACSASHPTPRCHSGRRIEGCSCWTGNVRSRHRTPPSRACWMNRLSAMARRSSLPKRIDRPCADAYCSAARAASMLAVSAARNAASAVPDLVGVLADLPFPLPLPLPFALAHAAVSPFGRGEWSCPVTLWAGAAEPSGFTTQLTNRRLPS